MNRITLPILILALSLVPVFSWAAEPNTDQAKAIAAIEKLGGKVTVDEKSPGKPVSSVDLEGTQIIDADLVHLKALTQLQDLDLCNRSRCDRVRPHSRGNDG
jgi:hypothetical protein